MTAEPLDSLSAVLRERTAAAHREIGRSGLVAELMREGHTPHEGERVAAVRRNIPVSAVI